MEYHAKNEKRYRKNMNNEMKERKRGMHRSLHSSQHGAKLSEDRSRIVGDATHDYSAVLGWLAGKK